MIETDHNRDPKWGFELQIVVKTNSQIVQTAQVKNGQSHFAHVAKKEEKYDED